MAWRKAEVYILTVLLLLVAVYFGTREPWEKPAFSFVAVTEEGAETIRPWHDGNGNGYVFLPSYVDLDQLQIRTARPVSFGDTKMTYGQSCDSFQLDVAYPVTGSDEIGNITFVSSQNMPTMYIDTVSGKMDHVHERKENKERGSIRLYDKEGIVGYRGNLDSVKIRGNSTAAQNKKPYNITLSVPGNLLNMGEASRWILLANAIDPTNMRNKIVLDFAEEVGLDYSPQSRWVDLYLNGEYAGLYLLCERNEVHPQRVAIPEVGSFLITMDFADRLKEQNVPYIDTGEEYGLRIRYTDVDAQTIGSIWRSIWNAITAEAGIDPNTNKHWTELIDMDSWIRKYLVEDIFGNVDGGRASQFYYYDGNDPSGKLYAGPVWNYDLAIFNPAVYAEFGRTSYQNENVNMFYVNCNPLSWYAELYKKPEFYDTMVEIYQKDFLPLLYELSEQKFDEYAAEISGASRVNQIRWDIQNAEEQRKRLARSIEKRIEFLNSVWLENKEYVWVLASFDGRKVNYAMNEGDNLSHLPQYDTAHWYIYNTDTLVDLTQPVYDGLKIRLTFD